MVTRVVLFGMAAIALAACKVESKSANDGLSEGAPSLKGRYSLSGNCAENAGVLSIGDDTIQFSETVCEISTHVEDGDIWRLDLVNCVSGLGETPDQRFEFFLDGKDKLSVFSEDGESHYTRCPIS